MKEKLCWSLVGLSVLLVAGCGLKGPLYFPEETAKVEPAAESVSQDDAYQKQITENTLVQKDESKRIISQKRMAQN